jgi:hypothetical protein
MTKGEMQDLVISRLQEKITDTFTIRERITRAFTQWYQAMNLPPEATEEPPPEEGGGGAEGDQSLPPPEGKEAPPDEA